MNDINSPAVPRPIARVCGVAAVLAPLLLLGSTVAYIVEGEGVNQGMLGGVIGVWSCFTFVIAFAGMSRLLEPRMPRAAAWLLVVGASGFTGGGGFNVDAMFSTVGAPELAGVGDEGGAAYGLLGFLPWGWFAPLSLVLAGAFLWRARVVPWWNGVLLILGGVLFVSARPERIDVLAVAGDVITVAALVPVGLAIFKAAADTAARTAVRVS